MALMAQSGRYGLRSTLGSSLKTGEILRMVLQYKQEFVMIFKEESGLILYFKYL